MSIDFWLLCIIIIKMMKWENDYEKMAHKRLQAIDKEVNEKFEGAFLSNSEQVILQQLFTRSQQQLGEVEI